MEAGERDEVLSWRAATVIMLFASAVTLTSRLLGTDPFTWIFDILIVYLTTAVLVGIPLLIRAKQLQRSTTESTLDATKAERTAA